MADESMSPEKRSKSILVVDDTPGNVRLLAEILTERGYKVRPALNGVRALETIGKELPDLVLLDIMMPGMDGYEVCRRMKAKESTRDIPVIFLSALDGTFDKVTAFDVGGVDYITKPFHAEEVLARVRTHLMIRDMQARLREQNRQLRLEIEERKKTEAALEKAHHELEKLASQDGLTQLANRRLPDQHLEKEWLRSLREQEPLSIIMCDIDYFKSYNDAYGHQAGDDCLKKIAQRLSCAVKRPADLVARYGGEEFVVVLPNTDLPGAEGMAHLISREIGLLKIPHSHSKVSREVTLSLGVACVVPDRGNSPESLVAAADKALYLAKETGRARIMTSATQER